ncbi:hypothetical protein [Pseudoalteromonas denitrificans]|jgi:hypothetical protein|uniref:Uncharacterized protein n=1 Tax=Pseudoalteromonas denitrificans DSM 6059 TaxID=1123010 RepID=A0A1I1RRX5_9GAMM|nr:hypothetical protein [Pseudoalteromonas denitrificans]SFD34988.1 hypothetical protein SAMN02745724_04278 [Pseudoalteromonas denitrificans DSM 6059]
MDQQNPLTAFGVTTKEEFNDKYFVIKRLCHPIEAYMILKEGQGAGGWPVEKESTVLNGQINQTEYTKQKANNESAFKKTDPRNTPYDKLTDETYLAAWQDYSSIYDKRTYYEYFDEELVYEWPGVTIMIAVEKKYAVKFDGIDVDLKSGSTFIIEKGAPVHPLTLISIK